MHKKGVMMGSGTVRLSWRKRLIFNLLMLIGVWVLIEALALAATYIWMGSPAVLARQRQVASDQEPFEPGGRFVVPTVIHPYVGAVMSPENRAAIMGVDPRFRINDYGFVDESSPIHKRSPDRVIIGILGGSVARQFSLNATDVLTEELSQDPRFAGKSIQFVRLAGNGYKQPQQLMIVNYLLTLGAEFDILINLDGVNEAALPAIDNVPHGVFSAYPRDWGQMIAGTARPEFIRMAGYVSYLRHQQRDDARFFGRAILRYSPTAQLLWSVRKDRTDYILNNQLEQMHKYSEQTQTYGASGPPEHFQSDDEMYDHCTALWSRSSMLLHQLAAARDIQYFHFLQPNQYVPGSKELGPQEQQIAYQEGSPMCVGVRACFPRMQAAGERMAKAGVRFTDLTRVFANHPEPIYNDICCHVLKEGDVIMARAIAARIRRPDPAENPKPQTSEE